MKKFLVVIIRKPNFSGENLNAHREYIQKLRELKILNLAGGFKDQTGGAYVLECTSLEEARNIIIADPMNDPSETLYEIKEWVAS
ncbi:hypothetical protein ABE41_018110 [Fictibacillus arsenicus]|uniref:YCII-related domain-containing protein n=1 Tax=Fictibacillus arsenicus TaxID=255247 RepID=A0A1B1Z910_9BACL|nr:YciI family protein [Fictibacillus arsenicus]ANX13930.1 hypothetical protein ABE41_018110 [Fictibacillus arsenicus]